MKKLLFLVLAFFLHTTAYAIESFSTVEERMTGAEFSKTGLQKLTATELAELNDWLRAHSVATLENARPTAADTVSETTGEATDVAEDKLIRSTIVGTFEGWSSPDSTFTLANGQVWKQAEKDVYYAEPTEDVQVEIRKPMLGKWRLEVVGTDKHVRVTRIQ
jgi:hypothetical protein